MNSVVPSTFVRWFAATILLLALAVAAVAYWMTLGAGGEGQAALIGGPFAMTDQNGRRVTEKDFLGRPMLISFGYTYCPDICPTQLQTITEALAQLGDKAKNLQPVFVTIDPERDTVEQMKQYVSNFAPGYIGLTGSTDDVAAIARVYRVYYAKVGTANDPQSYKMDHSSIVYLMDGTGQFVKHFSTNNSDSATFATQLGDALATLKTQ